MRPSRLLFAFPIGEGEPRQRRSGALVNGALETIFFALFHTASTLSGSLRSPTSPRGEGFVSGIAASPSNLRPFGAPPSIGRRECPHEPLPLEGATERSEAGLAFFFAAKSLPLCLPHWGKALCREKRCSRFAAFPTRGRLYVGDSGIPIQPPPLRGTSFRRKEGGLHTSPFPWKGLTSAARRGWLSFFCGEAASSLPSTSGKALCRENRYPRIAAFPIGEGGPRQRWIGCFR